MEIEIVARIDGKLLEASEVSRAPKTLLDEYVSIARTAIERAADPSRERFPPSLAASPVMEFKVKFLY